MADVIQLLDAQGNPYTQDIIDIGYLKHFFVKVAVVGQAADIVGNCALNGNQLGTWNYSAATGKVIGWATNARTWVKNGDVLVVSGGGFSITKTIRTRLAAVSNPRDVALFLQPTLQGGRTMRMVRDAIEQINDVLPHAGVQFSHYTPKNLQILRDYADDTTSIGTRFRSPFYDEAATQATDSVTGQQYTLEGRLGSRVYAFTWPEYYTALFLAKLRLPAGKYRALVVVDDTVELLIDGASLGTASISNNPYNYFEFQADGDAHYFGLKVTNLPADTPAYVYFGIVDIATNQIVYKLDPRDWVTTE